MPHGDASSGWQFLYLCASMLAHVIITEPRWSVATFLNALYPLTKPTPYCANFLKDDKRSPFFLCGSTTLYRALAFSTNSFHFPLSGARVFQFGTFNFCISFLLSSTQRVLGLPIGLLEIGFQEYTAFTILESCILSMWPSQLSLCARMKFIVFLRFINSSSSWLVFIRHIPLFCKGLFVA